MIGDFLTGNAATFVVDECVEVHQIIVLTEHIAMTLIVAYAGMVASVSQGGTHDVVLPFPRASRRVTHGVSQSLRAAGGGIAQIIVIVSLVEPRSLLIMLDVWQLGHFALQ